MPPSVTCGCERPLWAEEGRCFKCGKPQFAPVVTALPAERAPQTVSELAAKVKRAERAAYKRRWRKQNLARIAEYKRKRRERFRKEGRRSDGLALLKPGAADAAIRRYERERANG